MGQGSGLNLDGKLLGEVELQEDLECKVRQLVARELRRVHLQRVELPLAAREGLRAHLRPFPDRSLGASAMCVTTRRLLFARAAHQVEGGGGVGRGGGGVGCTTELRRLLGDGSRGSWKSCEDEERLLAGGWPPSECGDTAALSWWLDVEAKERVWVESSSRQKLSSITAW